MNEVAVQQPASELTPFSGIGNGTDLNAWVADLGNAYTLAERICRTPFAPKDFQGKPEAAAVAILHGKSLGLDPLASMSSIFVVSGRPGLYSKAMHAIVMAAGHHVWVESESAQEVVVKGKRRGSDVISTSRWTPERAQQAGYFSNAKYKTEPIAMLRARALGDVCRVVAPDVLAGLAYNEADVAIMEPMEDLGEGVARPKPDTASKPKRTVKRQQAPAPDLPDAVHDAPQGAEDETPADEADTREEPQEPLCSRAQQARLGEALKANGHSDRDDIIKVVTEWAGRDINASRELTVTEAEQLISELEEHAAGQNTDGEIKEEATA